MIRQLNKPSPNSWKQLCQRPEFSKEELDDQVRSILSRVQEEGDKALMNFSLQFDKVAIDQLQVSQRELEETKIDPDLEDAIRLAKANIEGFHKNQLLNESVVETVPGVRCWRKQLPIEKVGLYIPGGTAPLFSTVLMLGIPAKLAGCEEIILCTPPGKDGTINPAILFTAKLVGITKIFKVGGAQAIAAMAYGTTSIPQVYKIFGPGNQFVTKAKEMVQLSGTAIDMPAGPSELLIIADESCQPNFVAADLLSQAEHGADSQVVLLSNSERIIQEVQQELRVQVNKLPRKETAIQALKNSFSIYFNRLEQCIQFSNQYAPEHLILATTDKQSLVNQVRSAGSVFIGNYSCESAGDYASGTNHTLPTNGFARSYSGVSLDSFVKRITFQEISKEGIQQIGPAIEKMAEAEELFAHKKAVTLRLKQVEND